MATDGFGAFVSNVEGATRRGLLELKRLLVAAEAGLAAHLADMTAAHAASAISYAGGTNMSATDVEAALDELANEKSVVQSGSYTPTLTGMVVGTGGTNAAEYAFIGGPNTGDKGILVVHGIAQFGTAGQTFPTSPTISLPSGFSTSLSSGTHDLGGAVLADATGLNHAGRVWIAGATTIRPVLQQVSGATLFYNVLSTTTPFTWANGDSIVWTVVARAVRT